MKYFSLVFLTFLVALNFNSVIAQNLIFNPGCEDSLINGEIPYWTEVVGSQWTQRPNGNPPSYEGDNMFFAGAEPVAELQQDVDVSAKASAIDSSIQYFFFKGFVRAYSQNPPDHSRIILEYLDSIKAIKLDSIDLGEYSNVNEWEELNDTTLAPVGTRFIRIRLISTRFNGSNNDGYYDGLSLTEGIPVSVSTSLINFPQSLILYQNYPNPFNPSTKIKYQIPNEGASLMKLVQLKIFDVLGREVATLVDEYKPAGKYEVEFSVSGSRSSASGIYFYQLKAGGFIQTKKMLYLK